MIRYLENSIENMRDIGGYKSGLGNNVKLGKIIRSNLPVNLSDNDLLFLNSENSKIEEAYKGREPGCIYWLASSFLVTYDGSSIDWGIHRVNAGKLNIEYANDTSMIIGSNSSEINRYGGIRPVISLESDISISGGSGTSDDPYTIQ